MNIPEVEAREVVAVAVRLDSREGRPAALSKELPIVEVGYLELGHGVPAPERCSAT